MKKFVKAIAVMLVAGLTFFGMISPAAAATVQPIVLQYPGSCSLSELCRDCADPSCSTGCDLSCYGCDNLSDILSRYGCDQESCPQISELLKQLNSGCAAQQTAPQQPSDIAEPAPTEAPTQAPTQPETQAAKPTGYQLSAYELEVVELINDIRRQYGLGTLSVDTELSRVARIKSQDMHDKGYFDHNSPTYGTPFEMMKSFGISYRTAGENIAMGYRTPQSVVDGWMNSPGHRQNILNGSFTRIGMGYVESGNYWTQMFIG